MVYKKYLAFSENMCNYIIGSKQDDAVEETEL